MCRGDVAPRQSMKGYGARLCDSRCFIGAVGGNRYAHLCREHREFGESSIGVNTVEVVVFADIDPTLLTPGALTTPPASARNHALSQLKVSHASPSRYYDPYHLMPKNNGTGMTAASVRAGEGDHCSRPVLAGVCATQ